MNWIDTAKATAIVFGFCIVFLSVGLVLEDQIMKSATGWEVIFGPTLAIIYGVTDLQPFLFILISTLIVLIVCTRLFSKLNGWPKFGISVTGILIWLFSAVTIVLFAHGH